MEGEDCDGEKLIESLSSIGVCGEGNAILDSSQDIFNDCVNSSIHYDPKSYKFLNILNAVKSPNKSIAGENSTQCKSKEENYCNIDVESLKKLKDSTKTLLVLLEEIQSKTHSNAPTKDSQRLTELIKPIPKSKPRNLTASEIVGNVALKQLESHAKTLDAIYVEADEDDCSVYKRLIRKCNCLNTNEYNDFVIHFNEETNFFTNNIGEIIKNLKIIKKFLYMGGNYTKRALMFLNEGLSQSSHTEKTDIILGCSHADVCNIFEEHSIVTICISWPCKYPYYGDSVTQDLASELVYKLAQEEEGRRYLKFTSKITADIKKVLRKKAAFLEPNTLDCLNSSLNLMNPPLTQHIYVTYYSKPDEGFVSKTVGTLVQSRQYMALDEVFTHLDILHNMSKLDGCHGEFTSILPALLVLFKKMLLEYDNAEMNIIITNTLNNIVLKKIMKPFEIKLDVQPNIHKNVEMESVATYMKPIITKNITVQMPARKTKPTKTTTNQKINKSKIGFGATTYNSRQPSLRKVPVREPPRVVNRSRKFSKDSRNSIIIVPLGI